MDGKLFLSHAQADKVGAQTLRRALEDHGLAIWEDALELRAGDRLGDLEQAVKSAPGLLLLWTEAASESAWVEREAGWARKAREANPDYRLLVVLHGKGRISARRLLGEELIFIPVEGALEGAVPAIRRALDQRAAPGRVEDEPAPVPLLEELVISFTDVRVEESGGRHRAVGRFRLYHRPAAGSPSRSPARNFESPLGSLELDEIRWYLERYPGWPFGPFLERAHRLEASLPEWGRELYHRTLGLAAEPVVAWRSAEGSARRVVVEVEDEGAEAGAAAALFSLPWELLADEDGYLFEGTLGARVVRRIPRATTHPPLPVVERLRVLLIIARPEEEGVAFLDPRASARPLIEALSPLGYRAELEVLPDGTFPALRAALDRAQKADRPFQVVHFDGHGVYDPRQGLGQLCFEHPEDAAANKPERRAELIDADRLGALLRQRRVPLFVLEACQSAKADREVTTSVAARLLQAGVGSVLAMTHAVLVETARRFTGRFYSALAAGERIGSAMVAAEHHLRDQPARGTSDGGDTLTLQDWFVPVLFQEESGDLQLLAGRGQVDPQDLQVERRVREGELAQAPPHGFVGRARELLTVERRLRDERWLSLLGEGGQGKTALAVECARWLLDLRRVERLAFASVEDLPSARLLLERLGRQLVPGYSIAKEEGAGTPEEQLRRARLPVERVLAERQVLLVVDNLESVLPLSGREAPAGAATGELLALLADLARVAETRLLLTSREAPPAPLDGPVLRVGRLGRFEGRELVAGVLARTGQVPAAEAGEEGIDALVEKVEGHARSLVLLAPLVAEHGSRITAKAVAKKMAELEVRYPGQRERSLLASVRLSLDRLPPLARRRARALAVFHGSAHYKALAHVLEADPSEVLSLYRSLVDLGLGELSGDYFLPDPALGPALADELPDDERRTMVERWLAATLELISVLHSRYFQNAKVAVDSAQMALKDLLAALARAEEEIAEGGRKAESVMDAVNRLEPLVGALGQPAVLADVQGMRRRLEQRVAEWSSERFESARLEIEGRLEAGDAVGALEGAERLYQLAQQAGETNPELADVPAEAALLLGTALRSAGRASDALLLLDEAEGIYTELARAGDMIAGKRLMSVAAARGCALSDLGRWEEAARWHLAAVEMAEHAGDRRNAAAARGQLGEVRLRQGRLEQALAVSDAAREGFEALREPAGIASMWHQIGRVHQEAQRWDRAEAAYQRSLRIEVELGRRVKEAGTLGQLGYLYALTGRHAESAQLFQQAAIIFKDFGQVALQARSLGNLARTLLSLGRLDEAREAATRAGELSIPLGHPATPWIWWYNLQAIENAAGRASAAAAARGRAIELYAAYRRDGGEPATPAARLIAAVGQVLRQKNQASARRLIPLPEMFHQSTLPLRDALLAIVSGSSNAALAQDPRLPYDAAVEIALLLESLEQPRENRPRRRGLLWWARRGR